MDDGTATVPALKTEDAIPVAPDNADFTPVVADAPPPLREDQIQNAMAFLNHPKVRSAAESSKRQFLTQKGLTEAEINEAFSRIPSAPVVPSSQPASATKPPLAKPYPTATVEAVQPLQIVAAQQLQPQQQPVRWTQVAIGVGFLAASAYTLQQWVLPHLVSWIRGTPSKTAEEKSLGEMVASAFQKQAEEVRALVEVSKQLVARLDKEDRSRALTLQDLRSELRSAVTTMQSGRGGIAESGELQEIVAQLRQGLASLPAPSSAAYSQNGARAPVSSADYAQNGPYATYNGRTVAPPASRASMPMSKGYLPAPALATQGDRDPAGSMVPVSAGTNGLAGGRMENGWSKASSVASDDGRTSPSLPQHSPSYMQVLEMLEKGLTPPNVRSDIMDQPPNPQQPAPESRLAPREKPWLSTTPSRVPVEAAAPSHVVPGIGGVGAGGVSGRQSPPPNDVQDVPGPPFPSASLGSAGAHGLTGGWKPPDVPRRSIPLNARATASSYPDDASEHGSTASQPGPSSASVPA